MPAPGPLFAFGFSDVVAVIGTIGTIGTSVLAIIQFWDYIVARWKRLIGKPAPDVDLEPAAPARANRAVNVGRPVG